MGKKRKYIWAIGEELPNIDDHSLVKLEIIERYIAIYLKFLTKNPHSSELKLTIVDGFAGGGIYKKDIMGSPLRIKKAVEETQIEINVEREKNKFKSINNFDIDYIFIEKDIHTFKFLKKALSDFDYMCNKTQCIHGLFSQNLPNIIKHIKNKSRAEKSIFILDQYGYADAPIKDIHYIFQNLHKAEVILTFSVDSLIDYLSLENYSILQNQGLSKEECEKLLDVRQDDNFSREKIQPLLYQTIVQASGAPYYTPFFIKSTVSNRAYWLFHFSSHPTARDEMMKLHWDKQNTFQHFGKAGLKMLIGYESESKNSLFEFDNFAKQQSIITLSKELPPMIRNLQEISFDQLKNCIINDTPATVDIIKESLNNSIETGEISIMSYDKTSKRRKFTTIRPNDIIKWRGKQQTHFIF